TLLPLGGGRNPSPPAPLSRSGGEGRPTWAGPPSRHGLHQNWKYTNAFVVSGESTWETTNRTAHAAPTRGPGARFQSHFHKPSTTIRWAATTSWTVHQRRFWSTGSPRPGSGTNILRITVNAECKDGWAKAIDSVTKKSVTRIRKTVPAFVLRAALSIV